MTEKQNGNKPLSTTITPAAKAELDRLNTVAKEHAAQAEGLGKGGARGFRGVLISWLILHKGSEIEALLGKPGGLDLLLGM
jgi:hypothetical protein